MSIHRRTSRLSRAIVVLLVCITGVLVVAAANDDRALTEMEERHRREVTHRQYERRQHISNCNGVHQFVRQAIQYTNELPATKSRGTCAVNLTS